ncbi:MAG TPA: ATP-binding protein [Candidatus Thermoplasmatota archaeon]|nr:ATP-binding protein [Candidatus Thermoplasmatota archaeon]
MAEQARESRYPTAPVSSFTPDDIENILGSVTECVWSTDYDDSGRFQIRYCSPSFQALTGRPPSDFVEGIHRWLEIVHPDDRVRIEPALLDLLAGRADHLDEEYRLLRADGTTRTVIHRATVSARPFGGGVRSTGVLTDVTERREAEAALNEHSAELERSNRDLEQFAYAASHDLQEPLRVVRGYLQLLEKRSAGALDDRSRTFLRGANEASERMQRLIQDLLRYSRVGTRGGAPEPVEADVALDDALASLHVSIAESGAAITREPLPRVRADRLQLSQVFQNLVGNAVKFRAKESPRIHVAARKVGPEWEFTVSDNGIGIDPKDQQRLFVIFQRAHGEAYPGTGIGLALCKRIVERLGGRIWVESAAGKGARFRFTLPEADP